MITKDNFTKLLTNLGFTKQTYNYSPIETKIERPGNIAEEIDNTEIYLKKFQSQNCELKVDFKNHLLIYPYGIVSNRETTKNFTQNENFVIFECVCRLLQKGYSPNHIELEKPMPGGHHDTGGFCDIIIKDNNNKPYLLIECKTAGKEFDDAWGKMIQKGGQLFNYYNSYRQAEYLCLYASDFSDEQTKYFSHIIYLKDNDEYLLSDKKLLSFKKVQDENGGKDDYFKVWKETYQQDFATVGIFEPDIAAYHVGRQKYSITDLQEVDNDAIQKKYHEFATILRQHNVSGRENAFDKLVNLFLAKIVDETTNPNELMFYWKGAAFDDYFDFQDRLQKMYKDGMHKFLGETVTYIDNETIKETFHLFKNDPDATRDKILGYFRELKFFTNNDFAFLDVHNEQLFFQNAIILKKIVQMLQDIRLKTEEQNQFLGDLFEGFLDQGVKQSEGQFFTPMPIVKFLISSLPLENLIKNSVEIPKVIDYACGAGHFLNEYAQQIKPFVKTHKADEIGNYYAEITGIEKEYRLSKVAKVSAFMYGQDEIKIIYKDALALNPEIKDSSFSVLVANPPYSVKGFLETLTEKERNRFELMNAIDTKQIISNNSIETFFIERAKQLLKGGGVAAIVLPSSILSNGNIYIKCREIILKYFDLVAIAEFGSGTFGKTGTNTVTLFLRRKSDHPDLAEHYQNRVEAWFNNDFSKDEVFDDSSLLNDYCNHIGIAIIDYKTLLNGTPNETLLDCDIFKEYRKAFENDTKAKNIKKKRITTNYTKEHQQTELERYILDAMIAAESEKLYFYLLAASNPQPVLISKSPSDNKAMKLFLGYEWSGAKGSEGIKYIGANLADDEDMIAANNGISQIRTPLFNPKDNTDTDKINTLIRQNFKGEKFQIPESLTEFVSLTRLVDMIDFSRVNIDKVLRTSAVKTFEITSKYPLFKLSQMVEIISGGTPDTNNSTYWNGDIPWLSVADFNNNNRFVDSAEKHITKFGLEKSNTQLLIKGDIIISARGTVGVLAQVARPMAFNQSCYGLRGTKDVDNGYLYYILCREGEQFRLNATGSKFPAIIRKTFDDIIIPLPSLDIQQQIVTECEKVDEEYNSSRMSIQEYKEKIAQVFEDL
ncbi:MAG: N-6 DNA methylase, partial [Mariniphaga sp.]|nr:N-6 DNA methylase [Mariniphaga sp.]